MIEIIAEEVEILETEHGPFTNNTVTGETALQVYQSWLSTKDIPIVKPQTEVEVLKQQMVDANSMLIDMEFRFIMSEL